MTGMTIRQTLVMSLLLLLACGCAAGSQPEPAAQRATDVDPATTQPAYWLDQPAVASAQATDFDRLWEAAEDVARDFLFRLDRQDYRSGLLTTQPMVSGQWFEPWRRDVRTLDDRVESSLATFRRTVQFQFERLEDSTYRVTPRVLVERESLAEQRVTSVVSYRQIFRRPIPPEQRQRGTREADVGIYLPYRYWYPTARDPALERALAQAIEKKVARRELDGH